MGNVTQGSYPAPAEAPKPAPAPSKPAKTVEPVAEDE
jgi:hypothetical protein